MTFENFKHNLLQAPVNFIKKQKLLENLTKNFQLNKNIILFGPLGSGCTSSAVYYALNNSIFDNVFFIEAENECKLESEFRCLVHNVFKNDSHQISIQRIIDNFNTHISRLSKTLIIFDQLNDFNHIKIYLKNLPQNVQVLITSDKNLISTNEKFIKIKQVILNMNDAINYLKQSIQILSIEQTFDLADRMIRNEDFDPFRMKIISSYVNMSRIMFNCDDILTNIYANLKTPMELLTKNLAENSLIEYFSFILYLDTKFISIDLIIKYLELNNNKILLLISKLRRLEKLSIISFRFKNNYQGISLNDLTVDQLIEYFNSGIILKKNFSYVYDKVLNFCSLNFDEQSFDSLNMYNHIKKILKHDFVDINQFGQERITRISLLKSDLYYKLALFEFNFFLNYDRCIHYCNCGEILAYKDEFKSLKDLCCEKLEQNLNENINQEKTNSDEISNLKSQIVFKNFLKFQNMTTNEVFDWFIKENVCEKIANALNSIDGKCLKNYFLLAIDNPVFFKLLIRKEIEDLEEQHIDYFIDKLKTLFLKNY